MKREPQKPIATFGAWTVVEVDGLCDMISSRRRTGTLRGKLSARKIAELVKQAQAGKLTVPRHGDGGNLWLQIANNRARIVDLPLDRSPDR